MRPNPCVKLITAGLVSLAAMTAGAHPGGHSHEPAQAPEPRAALAANDVIGHGNARYKVNRDWGKVGNAKAPVANAHAMIEDDQGHIYLVTDHKDNAFIVYKKDGTFVRSFGKLQGGHGIDLITIDGKQYLIHVDCGWHAKEGGGWKRGNGAVSIIDKQGKVLRTLPSPIETGHYKKNERYQPCDVAVTPDGDILVVDGYATDRVLHYKADGKLIRVWGGRARGKPEHLSNAHGISIDTSDPKKPVVWVSSRSENKMKLFTLEGKYLETLTFPGAFVGQAFFRGDKVYIGVCWSRKDGTGRRQGNSGFLLVMDRKTRKVISAPGGTEPTYKAGKLQPLYQATPIFKHVHDLYVDKQGAIYVGEWNAGQRYPYKLEPVKQ